MNIEERRVASEYDYLLQYVNNLHVTMTKPTEMKDIDWEKVGDLCTHIIECAEGLREEAERAGDEK